MNKPASARPLPAVVAATPTRQEPARQARLSHGLYSKYVVLPGEDPAEFESLLVEMVDDLQPAGAFELGCVYRMAVAQWQLDRVSVREAGVYQESEAQYPGRERLDLARRIAKTAIGDAHADRLLDRISLDRTRLTNILLRNQRALATFREQRNRGLFARTRTPASEAVSVSVKDRAQEAFSSAKNGAPSIGSNHYSDGTSTNYLDRRLQPAEGAYRGEPITGLPGQIDREIPLGTDLLSGSSPRGFEHPLEHPPGGTAPNSSSRQSDSPPGLDRSPGWAVRLISSISKEEPS